MATFYEYHSGRHAALLNLDDVRHVRARDSGTSRSGVDTVVEFKDGTKVTLPGNDVEHMRQMSQPIVPAPPGFYVVRFFFWDETPSAAAVLAFPGLREPVLAWRCREIWPEAIVIDTHEPASDDGESAILYPTGVVYEPGGQDWPNIDAWAQYVWSVGPSGAKRKNPPRERGRRSMSGVLTSVPCAASVKETDRIESLGPMRPAGRVCM